MHMDGDKKKHAFLGARKLNTNLLNVGERMINFCDLFILKSIR